MLKNLSLNTKLIFLTGLAVVLGLIVSCVAFWWNDARAIRNAKATELYSIGQTLAFNCTGVLMFQDTEAGVNLLSAMESHESVEYACLLDADGRRFATHGKNPVEKEITSLSLGALVFTKNGYVVVNVPVYDSQTRDELLGSLTLAANTDDLKQHFWNYLLIGCGTVILALAVSMLPLILIHREVSQPILALADTAKSISRKEDYSIRLHRSSTDEIGVMYEAFNGLLDQVQHSEAEIKKVQLEILAAQQRAEHANQAKSEFLANMSHEIRTPLTGILGFTQVLLSDDQVTPVVRSEYLYTIQESGNHLLQLINDVLDVSKIEAGQLKIERIECNPHQVISQVVSTMRVKALEKNLTFDYRWGTDVPVLINSDPGRLRQLVLNLVSNAIKFTSQGGVFILANFLTTKDGGNARLTVDVVDTGVGIAAEKIDRVFEPFVQADNTVTRQYGGTGLGLAISRKLAQMLGGDLTLTSIEGRGSTFRLDTDAGCDHSVETVRAEAADALIRKHQSQSRRQGGTRKVDVNSVRVLIVEDGEVNRRFLTHVLSRAGADVDTAENGLVGSEMALHGDYDVIFMDMQMPVMDGYTAATKLRDAGYERPIIALTAHAMVGDREKCFKAGCSGYLSKPIDAQDLLETLVRTVEEELPDVVQRIQPEEVPQSVLRTDESGPSPAGGQDSNKPAIYSTLPCEDDADYQEIVEDFHQYLNQKLDLLEAALEREDDKTIAELAHWVKGSGGTAGFHDFTSPASELEQASRKGIRSDYELHFTSLRELAGRIELPWQKGGQ